MCRRQAGPRDDADVGHVVVAVVATSRLRAGPAGLMRRKRKDRARGALRARSVRCTRPVSQGGVTKFAAAGDLVREGCRSLHAGDPVRDTNVSNMEFLVSAARRCNAPVIVARTKGPGSWTSTPRCATARDGGTAPGLAPGLGLPDARRLCTGVPRGWRAD